MVRKFLYFVVFLLVLATAATFALRIWDDELQQIGLLSIDEVCERYNLTIEEFASWQRSVDRSGMQGLRVTRLQHYRDLYERQLKY